MRRLKRRQATSQAISRDLTGAEAIFRLAGALFAFALLFALTQAAHAQGAVRSVHGDWQIRCDTPPAASAAPATAKPMSRWLIFDIFMSPALPKEVPQSMAPDGVPCGTIRPLTNDLGKSLGLP